MSLGKLRSVIGYLHYLKEIPLYSYFTHIEDLLGLADEMYYRLIYNKDLEKIDREILDDIYHLIEHGEYKNKITKTIEYMHKVIYTKVEVDIEKVDRVLDDTRLPIDKYDLIFVLSERYSSDIVEEFGVSIDDVKDTFVDLYNKVKLMLGE